MFIADWILIGSCVLFAGVTAAWLRARRTSRFGPRRSPASRLSLLRRVPLFAGLDDAQLTEISAVVRELCVPEGAYVIRQHRAGEAMYVLLFGKMHILKRGASEQTLVQAVGPGELIGEMAVLTGARRIASARAISPCDLLQIDRDDFHELLAHKPGVEAAVWGVCERHSLDLTLRDHERLRALTTEQRAEWIASRRVEVRPEGATLRATEACYLGLIAGAIELQGTPHTGPEVILLAPGAEIRVSAPARLAWLPVPKSREAALLEAPAKVAAAASDSAKRLHAAG